jgi:hypothetical protein
VIEGVDLGTSPLSDLVTQGVVIGDLFEIDGSQYLPFTLGDVTIFLSNDLMIEPALGGALGQ